MAFKAFCVNMLQLRAARFSHPLYKTKDATFKSVHEKHLYPHNHIIRYFLSNKYWSSCSSEHTRADIKVNDDIICRLSYCSKRATNISDRKTRITYNFRISEATTYTEILQISLIQPLERPCGEDLRKELM